MKTTETESCGAIVRTDPMKEVLDLFRDTVVEASKGEESLSRVTRKFSSVPKKMWMNIVVQGRWEAGLRHDDSVWERAAFHSRKRTHAFETASAGKADYCVAVVYDTIDQYMVLPSPFEAMQRITELQGELGRVQSYASRCVVHLVGAVKQGTFTPTAIAYPWIESAIAADRDQRKEQSLDIIFDNLDELLLDSKFQDCNAVLDSMPIERLSNSQLLTVLTATAAAPREKLPARATFFVRTKEVIKSRGANAEELLVGLE